MSPGEQSSIPPEQLGVGPEGEMFAGALIDGDSEKLLGARGSVQEADENGLGPSVECGY